MTTKAVLRSIRNVTNGYSSVQVLVRECTSNDPSSPTISVMADIARRTENKADLQDTLEILDKRLNDKGKNWRHVAKALTLLDYLVRYADDEVVFWARDNIYIIKTLREFQSKDSTGNDQGSIVRVKAKELSSLLMDQERLKEERQAARGSKGNNSRRGRRNKGGDEEIYDEDLKRALDASKMTAEEEARMRTSNNSSDSLERAIQLSLEEEEMRKRKNAQFEAPDVYGFYNQQQPPQQEPQQIIGYDMFGNPVYGTQNDLLALQQQHQQELWAQQQAAQLAEQQQQLYLQQQQLYQQQMAAAQQQAFMQNAGSNNPFSKQEGPSPEELQKEQDELRQKQLLILQQQQLAEAELAKVKAAEQQPLKQTLTGSQKMNDQYSDLNNLLAQGTGIDTFGNTGDARFPAQFTQTGTFINSQGTGYKQVNSMGNPFTDSQYRGIVPAETGFGFGNQQKQQGNSLIDL